MVLYNVSAPGGLRNLLWHQRRILGELASSAGSERSNVFAVYTPDGDVYLEDFSGRLQGITAVRFAASRRTLPGGVPAASTYRFPDDIDPADLEAAHNLAVEAAEDWWLGKGGPQPTTFLRPVGWAHPTPAPLLPIQQGQQAP